MNWWPTLKRGRLGAMCVFVLSSIGGGAVLQAQAIPLPAQIVHSLSMPAGSSGFSDDVLVTKSQYAHWSLFLPTNGFQLTLGG